MKNALARKYRKQRIQVRIYLVRISLVFLCIGYWYYAMYYCPLMEPAAFQTETNKDAILYTEQEQRVLLSGFDTLHQMLQKDFEREKPYGMIPIPGMHTTKTMQAFEKKKISICTSMTPQGLCIAGKYLLISAYCHTGRHNSVIYVLDKETHTFIKELVLPGQEHVGGLAYDTIYGNIWVSLNHGKSAAAACFSIQSLEEYNLEKQKVPILYTKQYRLHTLERNSFMTYADGSLYMGIFTENRTGVVQKYAINHTGGLEDIQTESFGYRSPWIFPKDIKTIPEHTQGIAVYGETFLFSCSYGLTKSELLIYKYHSERDCTELEGVRCRMILPQKLQQIYIDGNELYLLFESAAYAYRYQPLPKVDHVLKLNLQDVLGG